MHISCEVTSKDLFLNADDINKATNKLPDLIGTADAKCGKSCS